MKALRFDLTGQRFGRLLVIRRVAGRSHGVRWWCECDCGNTASVDSSALRLGRTQSCGCYGRESRIRHGESSRSLGPTAEYLAWEHMKARCLNPKDERYKDWGGRGITVCAEWKDNFKAFLEHVGRKPSSAHSLDRIDNEKGYMPGNVRWATRSEQQRNRRRVTHCPRGHPLVPGNIYPNVLPRRVCIVCNRNYQRELRRRRREQRQESLSS